MPNITPEITAFENAVYGKDVREAIVDLANKLNDDLDDALTHELSTVDATLTQSGAGADAKVVGDKFGEVRTGLSELVTEASRIDGRVTSLSSQESADYTELDGRLDTVEAALPTLAPKASPVFTGSISLGRKSSSTIGAESIAVGNQNTASGAYSFAEGAQTTASGHASHAEGSALDPNIATELGIEPVSGCVASGRGAHAEGESTIASGDYSHAEGTWVGDISGVVVQEKLRQTEASGEGSHAEGAGCKATSDYSHVEGYLSQAKGYVSHVEGEECIAEGDKSHVGGTSCYSKTNAVSSIVHGHRLISSYDHQAVFGRSNVEDDSKALIIGTGERNASTRRNGMTLDWNGNLEILGGLILKDTATGTRYKITIRNGQINIATE